MWQVQPWIRYFLCQNGLEWKRSYISNVRLCQICRSVSDHIRATTTGGLWVVDLKRHGSQWAHMSSEVPLSRPTSSKMLHILPKRWGWSESSKVENVFPGTVLVVSQSHTHTHAGLGVLIHMYQWHVVLLQDTSDAFLKFHKDYFWQINPRWTGKSN